MYLFLTRSTLDIFNCAPTNPPDGHLYLQVVLAPRSADRTVCHLHARDHPP
jgi:hypothetical protein